MSEKTPKGTRKPPASAWRPGESGNPKGRPKGARNKTTLAVESLLQGQAEAVAQKAVALALEGDAAMIRVVLDRVSPVPKDKPVTLDMPALDTAASIPAALASILAAVACVMLFVKNDDEEKPPIEVLADKAKSEIEKRGIALTKRNGVFSLGVLAFFFIIFQLFFRYTITTTGQHSVYKYDRLTGEMWLVYGSSEIKVENKK